MRTAGLKIFLIPVLLLLPACLARKPLSGMGDPAFGVEVTWHGHSCFTVRDSLGRTVVIDPFDETVGYDPLSLRADALLVTHPHFDHNHKSSVKARSMAIDLAESTGTTLVAGDLAVNGLPSDHDPEGGQINGPNRIFEFTMGGLKIVHMGDYGQTELTPYQLSVLAGADILFLPVGGVTTMGPKQAKAIVDQANPLAVFPMHYGNIRFFKLAEVKEFTSLFKAENVQTLKESTVKIRKTDGGAEAQIFVLQPTSRNY